MRFDVNWLALDAAVFIATVLVTGMAYRYALIYGMLDVPNERSSHFVATPRGGGISIVIVFLAVVSVLFFGDYIPMETQLFYTFLLATAMIAVLGLIDDRMNLSPWSRLSVHTVVVSAAVFFLGVPTVSVAGLMIDSPWILYPLTVVALLWWLNLFNFMDGIDGIASIEALSILLAAIAILMITDPMFVLIAWMELLAFSIIGFLCWNWPPARIFMGDAASCFVGLILGLFALCAAIATAMNVWCWLIMFSVFWVDATVTLLIRIYRREKIHQAHRRHAYQLLAFYLSRLNLRILSPECLRAYAHRFVDVVLFLYNALYLFPLACLAAWLPEWAYVFALLAMAPMLWFSWQIRRPQSSFGGLL